MPKCKSPPKLQLERVLSMPLLEKAVDIDNQIDAREWLLAEDREIARRPECDDRVVGSCLIDTVVDRRCRRERSAGRVDAEVRRGGAAGHPPVYPESLCPPPGPPPPRNPAATPQP